MIKSEEGTTLNISGGAFTRTAAPRWGITGTVLVYGTTTITGGTFNEKSTSPSARVVVTGKVDGYDSVTYIKGGTFNGNGNNVFHHLSPAQADDSFEGSGGTFNKSIPDCYCSDGFIPTKNADGTYGVKVTNTGNGTIDAKESDCYAINVARGDLTIENGTFYGSVSVVQAEEGTLSVKGGIFDLHQKWEGSGKYLFNGIDDACAGGSSNVAISGGAFVGFDPSASPEGEGTSYLASGYAPAANADGAYGVKLAEGAYLLQDYRSGEQTSWTYPTHDGMAFAGWYKDASFTTPCTASDVEGAAYAKFVNIADLLLYKGGSPRMDVAQPSELTWLRFGYTMALPEGASFIENGWYFKKVSTSQPTDVRRLANNNVLIIYGTITANLEFTGVTTN